MINKHLSEDVNMKLSIKRDRKLKSISLYVNDIKTNVYTMNSIYAASMADQKRMFRNMASVARRIESGEITPYKYSHYKTEEQVWNHFDQCITIVWKPIKSVTLSREEFISLRKQGKISGNIVKLAVGLTVQLCHIMGADGSIPDCVCEFAGCFYAVRL